jgi:DNA-directed RNA polymerase specialized sigma24 family protein
MLNNANIYTLHTEEIGGVTRYFVNFKDVDNVLQEVEVTYDVYLVFEDSLRKEKSLTRWLRRRIERAALTDIEIYKRALHRPKSVENEVLDNLRNEKLEQAISELPETMRRRFILYHDCGLTYERIARIENRNIKSIFESIRAAEGKIREKMKNFES